MNYLVTGAAGFIGAAIAEKLIEEDNCVRNVNWDNLEKCFSGRDKIPYKMMEKCKPLALYNYLRLLTTVRRIVRRQ